MPILRLALVVSLLLLPHAVSAEQGVQWTKVQSEHFLFIGNGDEKTLRQIGETLERFRTTLVRVLGDGAARSPSPTVVFVFATEASFAPYRPHFDGAPVETRAYATTSDTVNYLVLGPGDLTADPRPAYHEYAHLVVSDALGDVPDWLHEGLAGFYETFETLDEGRLVRIGRPAIERLAVARQGMMPLEELLATTRFSSTYNVGPQRARFYAQSWALVHYLLVHRAKGGQVPAYVAGLRGGATSLDALAAAFGLEPAAVQDELETYVRRFTFPVVQVAFPEAASTPGVGRGTPVAASEALVYLADVLALVGRPAAAEAVLARVLARTPDAPRALSALGLVTIQRGQPEAGLRLLERAARLAPEDGEIQGAWGRALGEQARQLRGSHGHDGRLARARNVLATAATLSPLSASTLYQLALVELESGCDIARARTLLESASSLAPGRAAYRTLLMRVRAHQGDVDLVPTATPLVSPTLRPSFARSAGPGQPHREAIAVELPPATFLDR